MASPRFLRLALLVLFAATACSSEPAQRNEPPEPDAASTPGESDTPNSPSEPNAPNSPDAPDASTDPPPDDEPTLQQRIDAATVTAANHPACSLTELPEGFYWEIGDRGGMRASGEIAGSNTPTATTVVPVASASKWVYATYVLEKRGRVLEDDVPYLRQTSGWTMSAADALCLGKTVGECAANATLNEALIDRFNYGPGHFLRHAAEVMNLASMRALALTNEIRAQLGESDFSYTQTNLAGALQASASGYASFLRAMLRGEFVMSGELGAHKVCASAVCSGEAGLSPAPPDEAWSYSLGHWVEDDPQRGDHAFSSAGALGFYPWIDGRKTWYGVLARRAALPSAEQGIRSLRCGRAIRQAWLTGVEVMTATPSP